MFHQIGQGTVLNRGHHRQWFQLILLQHQLIMIHIRQTGQTSGEQKRTHTLSNGEVIWDIAGNVMGMGR
jgi:hypothetical protein